MTDPSAINRASWDARAEIHGQDDYYDTEGLIAGRDSLTDVEDAALREALGGRGVDGLDVLHVQCHLGFDAVSLARRGARVVGVDFSPVALRRARAIARACGVDARYVEGDATALPASLHGRFDVAYATIGVLCWIGDVAAWMRSVAACLRPGGRLVLVDGHPLANMIGDGESEPELRASFPYAFDGPHVFDQQGTYAGGDSGLTTTNVEYAHSLGELVTAALDAGLRLVALHEHLDAPPKVCVHAHPEPDGRWRLRSNGIPLPVLFTLLATRDA